MLQLHKCKRELTNTMDKETTAALLAICERFAAEIITLSADLRAADITAGCSKTTTQRRAIDDYVTMARLVERYPAFTMSQLRWIVANKERYSFAHLLKRIGRKLYINLTGFEEWIKTQQA